MNVSGDFVLLDQSSARNSSTTKVAYSRGLSWFRSQFRRLWVGQIDLENRENVTKGVDELRFGGLVRGAFDRIRESCSDLAL